MDYKVGIYIRVSTLEQAEHGYSLSEQEDRLRALCVAKGWSVYNVYKDDGQSGANLERKAMQKMIRDCKSHKIDMVLVTQLDRLSRSQKDVLFLIEDVFNKNDVSFYSLKETLDTSTPFGKAMIGILAVFAQFEREQIRERMVSGKIGRAKAGKIMSWVITPFGYKKDGDTFVINEPQAKVVKKMFEWYLENQSIMGLVYHLNDLGHQEKEVPWSHHTVRVVLTNPVYCGYNQYKNKIYKGNHEPIIDKKTFDLAQELIEERRVTATNPRPFRTKYMLSGLLRCAKCGSLMTVVLWKPKLDGTRTKMYYCKSRVKNRGSASKTIDEKNKCKSSTFNMEDLEKEVLDQINKLKIDYSKSKTKDHQKEIKRLEKEIKAIDKKDERLVELYIENFIEKNEFNKKKKVFNDQIKRLEEKIEKLKSDDQRVADTIKKMPRNVYDLSYQKQCELVRILINEIKVDDDQMLIQWNL